MLRVHINAPRTMPEPTAVAGVHPLRAFILHRDASSATRNSARLSVMNRYENSVGIGSSSTHTAVNTAAGKPASSAAVADAATTPPAVNAQLTRRHAVKLRLVTM